MYDYIPIPSAVETTESPVTSGSSETGIEAVEGSEGGKDAGLPNHQAAPGHAPRQEP